MVVRRGGEGRQQGGMSRQNVNMARTDGEVVSGDGEYTGYVGGAESGTEADGTSHSYLDNAALATLRCSELRSHYSR